MSHRRSLIILSAALASFSVLAIARPAQADILPDCEKTIYRVEGGATIECPDKKLECIYPDQYNPNNHGEITGVMVNRNCGFDDFVQLFINLSSWGLGIMAILALFFFIYGGFTLLIAGGRKDYVENGKKMLTGTVLGIIVMLTAWAIVGFYVSATTGSTKGFVFPSIPEFARPWFGLATNCRETYTKNYEQASCSRNFLKLYCADPVTVSNGPVFNLQQALNDRGCAAGESDGCYGPNVESAVRRFQEINGLTMTDPNTGLQISPPGQMNEAVRDALFDPTMTDDCTQTEVGACLGLLPGTETIACLADGLSRKACEQRFDGTWAARPQACTPAQ